MNYSELKRTKQKLSFFEIEGIYGLLGDLLEKVGISNGSDKVFEISKLKMEYLKKVKELEKPDLKQQKLFK